MGGNPPHYILSFYQRTVISMEASSALMGVGFIVGPRCAAITFSGGILGWLVLIPLITIFGGGETPVYPATVPIAQMSAELIWSTYIRYIGAGATIVGGLIGLSRTIPIVFKAFTLLSEELSALFSKKETPSLERTAQDIPILWIALSSLAILLTLWLIPSLNLNFVAVLAVAVIGFFFVTVSSNIVGYVGSSINPASGMIITTLLIISLIFVALNWTDTVYIIAAMTVGSVVGIAVCVAGDTSQDLKTGYLLGATPRFQQYAEILGVLAAASVMGLVIYLLDQAYTIGSDKLAAPQASMLSMIVKGVMQGNIPWMFIIIGIIIGLILEMMMIPILPFAIGLYLPLSMTSPIMLGGLVALAVQLFCKRF